MVITPAMVTTTVAMVTTIGATVITPATPATTVPIPAMSTQTVTITDIVTNAIWRQPNLAKNTLDIVEGTAENKVPDMVAAITTTEKAQTLVKSSFIIELVSTISS